MARTRALAAGKLALIAGREGREGARQQTEGELVGATDVWVGDCMREKQCFRQCVCDHCAYINACLRVHFSCYGE